MQSLEGLSSEQVAELAKLSQSLANNPKTRLNFLRLTKELDPSAPIPEVDLIHATSRAFGERDKKIESLEQKLLEKETKERISERRQGLRENGFTADDVSAIEKLMVERQIPSHDTAADFYKLQKQAAIPTPSTSRTYQGSQLADMVKEFGKNPVNASREAAHKAIDDIIKSRAKAA